MHQPLLRRTMRYCCVSGLIGGAASTFYMAVRGELTPRELCAGFCIGALISVVLTWYEHDFHRQHLKRLSQGAAFVLSATVYPLVMVACITPLAFAFGLAAEPFSAGAALRFWRAPEFIRGMQFGMCLSVVFIYVIYTARLVGARVLLSLFTGRYHTPFEEGLIFLFLDLRDSTKIAERIGGIDFLSLLDDFFTDVAHAAVVSRGEIHKYVGDEAIVVWSMNQAGKRAGCVRCVFALRQRIAEQARHYQRKYGLVPDFRAALHAGVAVTGEIGYFRLEIAHMGDTPNTTARILDQCRTLNEKFLVSSEALANLALPEGLTVRAVGEFLPRGKENPVSLFSIE